MSDFSNKTDEEIDIWIANHERQGQTKAKLYLDLLEERTRRRSKGLNVEKSLAHLMEAARQGNFTTYGDLAKVNGVDWSVARHLMNGAKGHLDSLLEICHARGLPLLTAICVNQSGLKDGALAPDALDGFAKGAQRLGYVVSDYDAFLKQCQSGCFAWGKKVPISI